MDSKELNKMKKKELVDFVLLLEKELVKTMTELDTVKKEYSQYKALKSGQIGHGATRNPHA